MENNQLTLEFDFNEEVITDNSSSNSFIKKIWFEVHSEMYGTTTACCLDIENDIKRGCVPCGSGEDYFLSQHEIDQLSEGLESEDDFTPSSTLEYPKNLVALLRPDGNVMHLPKYFRFDKKQYSDVKNIITTSGGIYKNNTFEFDEPAIDVYRRILFTNEFNQKKKFQFFATPEDLSDKLVKLADVTNSDSILEPSAGQGAIIKAINKVCDVVPDCYELMEVNVSILKKSGLNFNLIGEDFLLNSGTLYSKIIANPPFTKNQDIDHLQEMYKCLADGGRLVCITSESWVNGSQKKQIEFRNWLDSIDAEVIDIEKGAFKESGTMVGGKIVIINKP